MDKRYHQMLLWLHQLPNITPKQIDAVAGGASFRRYFRIFTPEASYIVMDSPPQQEPVQSFVAIDHAFMQLGLRVPEIYAQDKQAGFLLLEDFGDNLFFTILNQENVDNLFQQAFAIIAQIQSCQSVEGWALPHLDESFLLQEMQAFSEWYIQRYCGYKLSAPQHRALNSTFAEVAACVAAQSQVCIHRDFHTQNIMLLHDNTIGLLDFQSAMIGPITYDFVSLVKDCYRPWAKTKVLQWEKDFYTLIRAKNTSLLPINFADFKKQSDMTALQRHLKAILTYARKNERDGDNSYLQFIPVALEYIQDVTSHYSELAQLHKIMREVLETVNNLK